MKGTVSEITLTKRINMGNYEHEEIQVTYIPSEGESVEDSAEEIRRVVEVVLNQESKPVAEARAKVSDTKTETKIKDKAPLKTKASTPAISPKEIAKASKAAEADLIEDAEEVEEEVEVETPVEAPAKKAPVKRVKVKEVTYSREDSNHKKLVADFLTSALPDWKTKRIAKVTQALATITTEKIQLLGEEGLSDQFTARLLELVEG